MANVSHKLKSAFDGALAGGGDPASSPLYVFGPFLQLIVVAGVASVTFGASIWMVVLTVITVSSVYKLVMKWVVDGSGGSGLCEEEFGPWAVKINAGITIIEYTLTFLVSIAALVTFLSDRMHQYLSDSFFTHSSRAYMAIFVSILVGIGVNLGPRFAARIFGPATLGVVLLLWSMMAAAIWQFGLHLPSLDINAFHPDYIHYTLAGYARILALMTGIEIFANLVPAYQGPARERSKQAFGSLLIIMGTTSLTMLIVGPVILQLADPMNIEVSVFTQTMDKLLPGPLANFGTIIAVVVLLSAAAASAQGIQNLALGLRYRHYIPARLSTINRFEVADKPVWIVVFICILCFIMFGTEEETYLALYAAGVFILLSLTSWAAVKRLFKEHRQQKSSRLRIYLSGSVIAAILCTLATLIIFFERFSDGAWFYFLLTPLLYLNFSYFRNKLGKPTLISDRVGGMISGSTLPQFDSLSFDGEGISFKHILLPLNQSPHAELALSCAQTIARNYAGTIHLLTVLNDKNEESVSSFGKSIENSELTSVQEYLEDVKADLIEADYQTEIEIKTGKPAVAIGEAALQGIDLLIMTIQHKQSLVQRWIAESITLSIIHKTTPPLIVLRPCDEWRSIRTRFKRLLVTLDGSKSAEQVLAYAKALASRFGSKVTLLSVPEASDTDQASENLQIYLNKIARGFDRKGIDVDTFVTGTDPAQTILHMIKELNSDLVMMVSHGRGGIQRQGYVKLGSVVELVLQKSQCPLFLVSASQNSVP